jgi:hypothetical protein
MFSVSACTDLRTLPCLSAKSHLLGLPSLSAGANLFSLSPVSTSTNLFSLSQLSSSDMPNSSDRYHHRLSLKMKFPAKQRRVLNLRLDEVKGITNSSGEAVGG